MAYGKYFEFTAIYWDVHLVLLREFQLFLTPREHLFHNQVHVTVIRGGTARPHAIHYNHFFEGEVVGKLQSGGDVM